MINVLKNNYVLIPIVVCLCFTSLQQRGHLEMAPPFTVPCEGCEVVHHGFYTLGWVKPKTVKQKCVISVHLPVVH